MSRAGADGFPLRVFVHAESGIAVFSAVEVVNDSEGKGPEYHVSISKAGPGGTRVRCDSNDANWALAQLGVTGWDEDNHVPHGIVRNFWRTVAEPLIGKECSCKDTEPVIRENKGDFIWRPAPGAAGV